MENALRKRPHAQTIGRILMHGMLAEDYIKLMSRTELDLRFFKAPENPEDFVNVCHEMGDTDCALADKELAAGHTRTAATYYLGASALYRVADYGLVAHTEEKKTLTRKMVETFRKGKDIEGEDKPQYVEIPFEGSTMTAYLTVPENAPRDVPVVVVISGATGFKEENYGIARKLWERGVASITFDGPGQGEALLFHHCYYTLDNYERAVRTIIEYVRGQGLTGPVGLVGISYGGYLAPRCAIFNSDLVSALCMRGGTVWSDDAILARNEIYRPNFMLKCNITDADEMRELSHKMNIEGLCEQITCPLLIAHTEEDYSAGTRGAKYVWEHASSTDKEFFTIPGDLHCGDNEDTRVASHIADWFVDHLK